jgi:hypothetical protein
MVYLAWAPVYDRVLQRFFAPGRTTAVRILDLRPGERVLLVGVGTGQDLPLLPAGVSAVGVDLSEHMLRRAARHGSVVVRRCDSPPGAQRGARSGQPFGGGRVGSPTARSSRPGLQACGPGRAARWSPTSRQRCGPQPKRCGQLRLARVHWRAPLGLPPWPRPSAAAAHCVLSVGEDSSGRVSPERPRARSEAPAHVPPNASI